MESHFPSNYLVYVSLRNSTRVSVSLVSIVIATTNRMFTAYQSMFSNGKKMDLALFVSAIVMDIKYD